MTETGARPHIIQIPGTFAFTNTLKYRFSFLNHRGWISLPLLNQRASPAVCSRPREQCPVASLHLKKLVKEKKSLTLRSENLAALPLPPMWLISWNHCPSPTPYASSRVPAGTKTTGSCHHTQVLRLCLFNRPTESSTASKPVLLKVQSECFGSYSVGNGPNPVGNGLPSWLFQSSCFICCCHYCCWF